MDFIMLLLQFNIQWTGSRSEEHMAVCEIDHMRSVWNLDYIPAVCEPFQMQPYEFRYNSFQL